MNNQENIVRRFVYDLIEFVWEDIFLRVLMWFVLFSSASLKVVLWLAQFAINNLKKSQKFRLACIFVILISLSVVTMNWFDRYIQKEISGYSATSEQSILEAQVKDFKAKNPKATFSDGEVKIIIQGKQRGRTRDEILVEILRYRYSIGQY